MVVSQTRKGEETKISEQRSVERRQSCLIPECNKANTYSRSHAFQHHVPNLFQEGGGELEEVTRRRVTALKLMTSWLLGNRAKLEDLVTYVNSTEQVPVDANREVSSRLREEMEDMSRELMQQIPERFVICPMNCLAALLHWRVLIVIIAKLEPRHRQCLMAQFHDSQPPEPNVHEVRSTEEETPEGFDSHFHLDRLQHILRMPGASLAEVNAATGEPLQPWRVKLVGAVANFCDPATYPTLDIVRQLNQEGVLVTVGLHPKDANEVTDETLGRMRTLLKRPEVVGLGEVGIDHSVPPKYWGRQLRALNSTLTLLQDRHVLVIHCRNMESSGQISEAYYTLLYHLQPRVRKEQNIHLHCFSGSADLVSEWKSNFPNTYFGFTRMVDKFDEDQIGGLQAVEDDKILLETDAPYFQFSRTHGIRHSSKYSAPILIGLTAAVVAPKRQEEARTLLRKSVANAQRLYGGLMSNRS